MQLRSQASTADRATVTTVAFNEPGQSVLQPAMKPLRVSAADHTVVHADSVPSGFRSCTDEALQSSMLHLGPCQCCRALPAPGACICCTVVLMLLLSILHSASWNAGLVLTGFSASVQAPLHANTDIIRSIVCTEQGFIFTVSYDRCIMIYEVGDAPDLLLLGVFMNPWPAYLQTATLVACLMPASPELGAR